MKRISILFALATIATAQSGGPYEISNSARSSGGGNAAAGNFQLESTIGQSIAGGPNLTTPFLSYSGFWTPTLAPTAASVSISGRVRSGRGGRGLANAMITIVSPSGTTTTVRTNISGNFRVDGLRSGDVYVLSVLDRRYSFAPILLDPTDDVTDLEIVPN